MPVTTPPAITALPAPPDPNDRATFNARAYPWSVAQQTLATQVGAVASNVAANATDAETSATLADADRVQTGLDAIATAADRVQTGLDRTQAGLDRIAAADSAVQASKLNLGNKAAPPTLDNQGAALLAGATYYDTVLNKWRVWTGAAWGDGISAISGVSSVNGQTGDVTAIATTASNTFTAAQEWATGAAIASAATVNLDAATGNRVHITGTTTITAVTLTRGPRTVIFDGVLTLTHHATNNNLPGETNITTAAGDRAIYESDGTTVYCVSYIRASGVAVVAPAVSVGNHEVTASIGNGHGSTNINIRRFTTVLVNTGTAITYADSSTLGALFTINETGLYEIYYSDVSSLGQWFGVSRNASNLATSLQSTTDLTIGVMRAQILVGYRQNIVTRTLRLIAGDLIRAHTNNSMTDSNDMTIFSIRKVGV